MPRDLYAPVQACLRGQAPLRLVEKAVREEGADPNSWLGPLTPVRCAVENDHVSLLELLLRLRGDPNQRDARGVCPLHMAVFDDRGPCVAALLDGQADVNIRDQHGQTPIFFAPSREICELLISRRADVDVRNIKSQSPLHLAAHAGLDDAVEWLVDASDKRMLEAKDQKGHTPLYYAAHARLKSTIGVLKKMGAEVSNVRPNGNGRRWTPPSSPCAVQTARPEHQTRRSSSLRSRTSTPVTMRSGAPGNAEGQEPQEEAASLPAPPASAPCQTAKPSSPEAQQPAPSVSPSQAQAAAAPRALEEVLLEGLRRGEECSSSRTQPPELFTPPVSAVLAEQASKEEEEERRKAEEAHAAAAAAEERRREAAEALAAEQRLQQQRAEEQQRREARCALETAMASEDTEALELALKRAEDARVERVELEVAQELLKKLQGAKKRKASEMAIKEAAAKEDVEALEAAVSEAGEVGVSEEILKDARGCIHRIQSRLQARWEAVEALRRAERSEDLEVLGEAVRQAEAAGVNCDVLKPARERMEQLQAQAQRRSSAEEAIERAVAREHVEGLESAVREAREAGVREEVLKEAELSLQGLRISVPRRRRAQEDLASATKGEDILALEAALEEAQEAGVKRDLLQDGKHRLQTLQAQARRKRDALSVLAAASNEESLEAAIAHAEAEGVGAESLEEPRAKLEALRAQALRRREALAAVAAGASVESLEVALARAEAEGVAEEALEDGRSRLRSLQAQAKRRAEAEAKVAAAARGEGVEELAAALEEAEEAGVSTEALKEPKARLEALRAQALRRREAAAQLERASEEGRPEELEEAIAKAEAEGVGQEALEDARLRLQSLQAQALRRMEAEAELARACQGEDIEALEAAIVEAEEAGVSADSLEEPQGHLQALRSLMARRSAAEAALEAAQDEEALEWALREADEAGVDASRLEEAHARLQALWLKPAAKKEEEDDQLRVATASLEEMPEAAADQPEELPKEDDQLRVATASLEAMPEAAADQPEELPKAASPEEPPPLPELGLKAQAASPEEPPPLPELGLKAQEQPSSPALSSKDVPKLPLPVRGKHDDLTLAEASEDPSDATPADASSRFRAKRAQTDTCLDRHLKFRDSPEIHCWLDSDEHREMRQWNQAQQRSAIEDDEESEPDSGAEADAERPPQTAQAAAEVERWQELSMQARRRRELEAAQRREELRRALLRAASEDDPLALAVALGRAEEAGVDAEALGEGRSRLRGLSSSRWGEAEASSGASSSWEQPPETTPVQPEVKDGCLLWEVLLQKESEEDKFGFVQANGKLDFESRLSGGSRDEGKLATLPGPQVLIVRRIHHQGLLHRWNLRHPEAQVRPQDRIISVNGEDTLEAMQREIRSTKILIKVMRYPEVFAVTLRREGRRLGFRIEYPQDSDTPEVRISQLTEGALPVHNQEQVMANMWHYVVLPDMRIQAANGASGSAWLIAEELKLCKIVTLIVRRAEHKEALGSRSKTSPAISDVALTVRPPPRAATP